MKILLLGAPGAGKGTMAAVMSKDLRIPHISTGDMLRQEIHAKSELGLRVKSIMDRGEYVADELMLEIMKKRLESSDCDDGYILDGFPRTLPQAEALKSSGISLDVVLVLDVTDELVVSRLTGRRVHPASGRTYHIINHPPKVEGKDDATGEPLIQRDDDKAETVLKRLDVYRNLTKPLIDYYKDISITLDGAGSVESVEADILAALKDR